MKKNIIIVIGLIVVIILLGIILFNKGKELDNNGMNETEFKDSVIYDKDGNLIYDISKSKEIEETVENITIQGVVELNHNGYIYIFNGQHFGESGIEMKEYTRATINDKKQECIDYYTSKKYDTSYIQEGDIIICTGDLIKYKYTMGDNDFDTKDNTIIVLKENDYTNMKKEAINKVRECNITIDAYYDTSNEIYLKYEIFDKIYKLPFALKFNITENVEIIGEIANGKNVKVEYKDSNVSLDKLEIKKIEVVE